MEWVEAARPAAAVPDDADAADASAKTLGQKKHGQSDALNSTEQPAEYLSDVVNGAIATEQTWGMNLYLTV